MDGLVKNKIGSRLKKLILSHNLFVFGRELFLIFMALYIWNQTKSLPTVALFSISYLVFHTISFTLFANSVKNGSKKLIRNIGIIGTAIFFVILFLLKDNAINYLNILGAILGFFNGMYWIAYHIIRFDLTNTENRGNFHGMSGGLKTVFLMLVPIIGGALITYNLFGFGYGNIFILGSIIYLLSLLFGKIKMPHLKTPKLHLLQTFKLIFKNKEMKKYVLGAFFGNMSQRGSLERLIPILLFDILQNEFHVGGWLTMFTAISIITTIIIGKFIPYKHYKNSILIGGGLFFLSILALAGIPMLITYILFGFVREIILPLLSIPRKVYKDNLVNTFENLETHRVEYIVIMEWFTVTFGRLIGWSVLLFVTSLHGTAMQYALFAISIGVVLETLFLRSIKINLNLKRPVGAE
ncbi:MAG: MFS transporter [Patescibacteria group bacterium]